MYSLNKNNVKNNYKKNKKNKRKKMKQIHLQLNFPNYKDKRKQK